MIALNRSSEFAESALDSLRRIFISRHLQRWLHDNVAASALWGLNPSVGKENFAVYIRANNRAATVPTILPALLLLIVSALLLVYRPTFIRHYEAAVALGLNLIALGSTMVWQRRIQGELAISGYNEAKIHTHHDKLDPDSRTSAACRPGHGHSGPLGRTAGQIYPITSCK